MTLNLPELDHHLHHWGRSNLVETWDLPWTIHLFEQVESTNQTVWAMAAQGAPDGTVAIALRQQAGRGQWGRQWQSALGGLYLSVLLTPNCPANCAGQLTLAMAWGIATELRLAGVPVRVKWPNDLMGDRRKLGGILTETRLRAGRIQHAVVGVGINWNNLVPDSGIALQPWMGSTCPVQSLEMLAAIVLWGISKGDRTLKQQGVETIRAEYEQLMTHLGTPVTFTAPTDGPPHTQTAVVVGVSTQGYLRVRPAGNSAGQDIELAPGAIRLGYEAGMEGANG